MGSWFSLQANDGGKDAAGASGESAEELKERLAEAEAKLARMTEVAKKFQVSTRAHHKELPLVPLPLTIFRPQNFTKP